MLPSTQISGRGSFRLGLIPSIFYENTGFSPTDGDLDSLVALAVLNQSSGTAAHEFGHNLGLRHIDSVGAPGDGLPDTGEPENDEFFPSYTAGPRDATETFLHLMASGASVGLPSVASQSDRFFSERSAVKLSLAFYGATILSEAEAVSNGLTLSKLNFPNTVLEGENFGSAFLQADVGLVQGRISEIGEVDQYRVSLQQDRFLTVHVMSFDRPLLFVDDVVSRLKLFRELDNGDLSEVIIESSQEFEGLDPLLFDFPIENTGIYILQIDAPDIIYLPDGSSKPITSFDDGADFLTGDYLLYAYSYKAPLDIFENTKDPCEINPCLNGGACVPGEGDAFTCNCPEGFSGETCEKADVCESNPCLNGGTCVPGEGDTFTCNCPEGFSGETCEKADPSDACESNPCLNGGTCVPGEGDAFTCNCPEGFSGDLCETDDQNPSDICESNPCENDGTCVPGEGDAFTCTCPEGFSGKTCGTITQSKSKSKTQKSAKALKRSKTKPTKNKKKKRTKTK